ncbi:MAG TPA: DNA-3-methyladenine glycosylase [Bacteroidales bacterium]|nr:DNA-3-methyladenine glycosylase [Bacteroidales bacterium]
MAMLLSREFYNRTNVVQIARELLGKKLFTHIDGETCSGIICETEAYAGITDRASHAYGGRRTARTEIMFRQGGTAYVYLCYGIHSLFNIVTNVTDVPHAVLIRGIIPETNQNVMAKRSGKTIKKNMGIGPGNVSKLLGIHYSHTGLDLCSKPVKGNNGDAIWLMDEDVHVPAEEIEITSRVGVEYAGADALLPYRFIWRSSH